MASNENILDEEDDSYGSLKPVGYFRDRSFSEIPCYRNSFLYGIAGAFGIGITEFMFTSNVKRATRDSIFGFVAILLPYYFYCRHQQAKDRFHYQTIRSDVQRYIERQGVDIDPEDIRKAAIEAGLPPAAFLNILSEKAKEKSSEK